MLNVAVLENDATAVYEYIFNDGNVDEPNDVGNRPLHACAFTGNVSIARILIKAGANVHCVNLKGRTPLHIAVGDDRGNDMVKYLLECGADPQAKDCYFKTPRDYATPLCAIPLDEWLLEKWDQSFILAEDEDDDEEENDPRKFLEQQASFHSLPSPSSSRNNPNSQAAETLLAVLSQKAAVAAQDQERRQSRRSVSPMLPLTSKPTVAVISPITIQHKDAERDLSPIPLFADEKMEDEPSLPFVEIDGERVYIPQYTRAITPLPAMFAPLEEEDENVEEDEELTPPLSTMPLEQEPSSKVEESIFQPIEVIVHIPPSLQSNSLGMMLSTEHEKYLLVVENLSKHMSAYKSGIRVGDAIWSINQQNIEEIDMDQVGKMLMEGKRGGLEIKVMRELPTILAFGCDSIDWSKPNVTTAKFAQLVMLLENVPINLTEEQCFKLIHCFQEAIALFRKGEASMELVEMIQTTLGKQRADVVEHATEIVMLAVKQMETINSLEDLEADDEFEFISSAFGEMLNRI